MTVEIEDTRNHCVCAGRLDVAEKELKQKALLYPQCAIAYQQAALEVRRVSSHHFQGCSECQAEESAGRLSRTAA